MTWGQGKLSRPGHTKAVNVKEKTGHKGCPSAGTEKRVGKKATNWETVLPVQIARRTLVRAQQVLF